MPGSAIIGDVALPEPPDAVPEASYHARPARKKASVAESCRLMHSDLAIGVLQNFRRVLAELQGLRVDSSAIAGSSGSDDGTVHIRTLIAA